jgi:hypothetical protein
MYFAGGLAEKIDNNMLVFVIFCLNRNSDRSISKNSTANANNRIKILHESAKKAIINNIKRLIACWIAKAIMVCMHI